MIDIAVTLVHGVEEIIDLTSDCYVRAVFEWLRRQEVLHIQVRHGVRFQRSVRILVIR